MGAFPWGCSRPTTKRRFSSPGFSLRLDSYHLAPRLPWLPLSVLSRGGLGSGTGLLRSGVGGCLLLCGCKRMARSQTLRKEPHCLQALKGPLRTPTFLPHPNISSSAATCKAQPRCDSPRKGCARLSALTPRGPRDCHALGPSPRDTHKMRPVASPWSLRSRAPPSTVDEAPAPSLSGRWLLSPAAERSGALPTGACLWIQITGKFARHCG